MTVPLSSRRLTGRESRRTSRFAPSRHRTLDGARSIRRSCVP